MLLHAGRRLSHYEVLGPLGAGAMGEVWRALDSRLGREVALKVLPAHFSSDEERLRRFEREARSLASLNHPHIAQIYGIDQADDASFLVLELVPGETLAARLSRGALPLEEALRVCSQIALGLEVAHEAGVIHRDLKPANVILTPEGKVKLLDFGLAKPIAAAAAEATWVDGESGTVAGALLGTPTYMAPEQARGARIDKRVDVWAFGCVLFECLTGKRAFNGSTVSDVLAAVLQREVDFEQLPAATPVHVRKVLERCLRKDADRRLRDMGDARLELEEAPDMHVTAGAGPARLWGVAALFFAVTVAGFIAARSWTRSAEPPPVKVRRFALTGLGLDTGDSQGLVFSKDGSRLIYAAMGDDGRQELRSRALDELGTMALIGTEGWGLPSISSDGQQLVAFASGLAGVTGVQLRTLALTGGQTRTVASLPFAIPSGATWLSDDSIVFAAGYDRPCWRVSALGGQAELFEVDGTSDVDQVLAPVALPGDEAILCCVGRKEEFDLALIDLASRAVQVIVEDAYNAAWLGSGDAGSAEAGHVLYQIVDSGVLMALPFDARRRVATGPAIPVVSDMATWPSYQARTFAFAEDGTLAYIPESAVAGSGELVWLDEDGGTQQLVDFGRRVGLPRISHDGTRIAFRATAQDCSIWVHDTARGTSSRLTSEGDNHGIAWSPDDRRIAFARDEPGGWGIFSCLADGSGALERHGRDFGPAYVAAYTKEGEHLVVQSERVGSSWDIDLIDLSDGSVRALLGSRSLESQAALSPNNDFIAYVSDSSGRAEVYVQPFPDLGTRTQISQRGGMEPVWSRDGTKLYFNSSGSLHVVDVELSGDFVVSRPRLQAEDALVEDAGALSSGYDAHPDGRLVAIRKQAEQRAEVHVVLNAAQELRARSAGR